MKNTIMDALKQHITLDNPLGPIDARDFESQVALQYLFEEHNRMYKNLLRRPSVIIGRRGSGKTSYLKTVYFDGDYDFFVEINTAKVLQHMVRTIQEISHGVWFVESIAELWETVIWIAVFNEVRKCMADSALVDAYLAKVNVRDANTVDDIFWTIADTLSNKISTTPVGIVAELLRQFDNISFRQVKDSVIRFLKENDKRGVILMDSLEDFFIQVKDVERSLRGLLKFVGAMNTPSSYVDIRFCMPSELYHEFIHISSNPLKDFKNTLSLQWIAKELILLGAQRIKFFLQFYYPRHFEKVRNLDPTLRSDAIKILLSVFPKTVTNRMGQDEHTISYILRHTQLLPRQYLMILNNIFRRTIRLNHREQFQVSSQQVLDGVRETERIIVEEILSAYKTLYPNANIVCERCLPELPHSFSQGDLQRNFRRHGKSAMGNDNFHEFRRMLIEIGIIGRELTSYNTEGDVEKGYTKGLFEYTVSHKLALNTDDILVLHPLFSGVYGRSEGGNGKVSPVYPYGAQLDEDYRDSGTW